MSEIDKRLRPIKDFLKNEIYSYQARRKGVPLIIVNTIPKSGTIYIREHLSKSIENLPLFYGLVGRPFYDALLNEDMFKKYSREGGRLFVNHFMPNYCNLQTIRDLRNSKVVVHVRDPRQVLISWVHYNQKLEQRGITTHREHYLNDYNDKYFAKNFSEQLDFNIEVLYPRLVQWIEGWKKVEEDKSAYGIDVLFTKFSELKNNPSKFFQSIYDFYGVAQYADKSLSTDPHQGEKHYRKGEIDEWKSVLSDKQKDQVNSLLSKDLREKFGWK